MVTGSALIFLNSWHEQGEHYIYSCHENSISDIFRKNLKFIILKQDEISHSWHESSII